MTRTMWTGLCLALVALAPLAAQQPGVAETLLQTAIKKEVVDGNLAGAIEGYKKVLAAAKENRRVAANALVHMAACYQKMGDAQARKLYEQVVKDYSDQREAVARARAALGGVSARTAGDGFTVQRVWAPGDGLYLRGSALGSVTPDGRYLAFADWQDGKGNLAVRDLTTGESRLLTHDANDDQYAEDVLFSPDGKQIFYRWEAEHESLRQIAFDGTHMREIARLPDGISLRALSPDGRRLAAVRFNIPGGDRHLVIVSTSDGSMTELRSTGIRVTSIGGFSADGQFLVYAVDNSSGKTNGGVFTISVDSAREQPLAQGPARYSAPIWTLDRRAVVFVSDRSGRSDLWSIDVVDGRPEGQPKLLKSSFGAMEPKGFTRDGSLYYATDQAATDLYGADFDAGKLSIGSPARITEHQIGSNMLAKPSPDGKMVALVRSQGQSLPAPLSLVIRSTTTGEEKQLGQFDVPYPFFLNRWFPDSQSVLVALNTDGRLKVQRVDVRTGEAQILLEGIPGAMWPGVELSQDSKTLFYSTHSRDNLVHLVRRELATGQETELYRTQSDGVGCFGLTISPDGKNLAFLVNTGKNRRAVLVLPTGGGTPREIFQGDYEHPRPQGAAWTGDGRYVIVTESAGRDERTAFRAIPVEGGESRRLAMGMDRVSLPAFSADGHRILFTSSYGGPELWVIRNFLPNANARQ